MWHSHKYWSSLEYLSWVGDNRKRLREVLTQGARETREGGASTRQKQDTPLKWHGTLFSANKQRKPIKQCAVWPANVAPLYSVLIFLIKKKEVSFSDGAGLRRGDHTLNGKYQVDGQASSLFVYNCLSDAFPLIALDLRLLWSLHCQSPGCLFLFFVFCLVKRSLLSK